jgi:hypothetical protein
MGLLGSYSNPESQRRLRRLADELDRLATQDSPPRYSQRQDRKLRNGLVPRAIQQVLADAEEPMRVRDIYAAVQDRLGMRVPVSSVNAWLSQNAKGKRPMVVRLGHGRYRLLGETSRG